MARTLHASALAFAIVAACGGESRHDRASSDDSGAGNSAVTPGVAGHNPGPNAAGATNVAWPSLDGVWAMFDFEDPVTVALSEHPFVADGNGAIHELTGKGSCTPFDTEAPAFCGGDIRGERTESRARFTFPAFGGDEYATDAFVAADASRMSGTYGLNGGTSQTAWVRLPPGQSWLESNDTTLSEAVNARAGRYELYFTAGDGSLFGFSPIPPDLTLRVRGTTPMLSGMFGSFWAGEMRWEAATQTLAVGPVPVTNPTGVIAVRLMFEDTALSAAEATAADGSHYTFTTSPF